MAKVAFYKKNLFTSKLHLEVRKKLLKYSCSAQEDGTDTAFQNVGSYT